MSISIGLSEDKNKPICIIMSDTRGTVMEASLPKEMAKVFVNNLLALLEAVESNPSTDGENIERLG